MATVDDWWLQRPANDKLVLLVATEEDKWQFVSFTEDFRLVVRITNHKGTNNGFWGRLLMAGDYWCLLGTADKYWGQGTGSLGRVSRLTPG